MLTLVLVSAALAAEPEPSPGPGTLNVDAKVPTEILVDGVKLGQLWFPGSATFLIQSGPHVLRVYTNGQPEDFELAIVPDDTTWVVVGRTGVSLDVAPDVPVAVDPDAEPPPMVMVPVEFRAIGGAAQVRLDKQRLVLGSGERLAMEVGPGSHLLSVRSVDGTVIWATGTLEVAGDRMVVQVAEGRLPEVSGVGRFHASGG